MVLEYVKAFENIQYQYSGPCAINQTYAPSVLPLQSYLIYCFVLFPRSPNLIPTTFLFCLN